MMSSCLEMGKREYFNQGCVPPRLPETGDKLSSVRIMMCTVDYTFFFSSCRHFSDNFTS